MTGRKVTVKRKVLEKNEVLAAGIRKELKRRGIIALNLISSPGTGKTLLLERTLERIGQRVKCAVIVGDQQTDNDARRLEGKGAPVRQIETGNTCHLDAGRIKDALDGLLYDGLRILFIENIGNLICPAAFDLGENMKVGLLSVTEGEDKPLKYPSLFCELDTFVLTKTDLIPHLEWNRNECIRNLKKVSPKCRIFEVSARTGAGLEGWIRWLGRLARGG